MSLLKIYTDEELKVLHTNKQDSVKGFQKMLDQGRTNEVLKTKQDVEEILEFEEIVLDAIEKEMKKRGII